jgi:outer membrane protein assembly factor BamD (BamD/ComL family)
MQEGDSSRASGLLSEAHRETIAPREDREIALALAGTFLDQRRWNHAHDDLVAIEASWLRTKDAIVTANPEQIQSRIDWNAWLEEWDDSRSVLADLETHERVVDAMTEACFQPSEGEVLSLPSGSFRLAQPANVGFDLPPPDPAQAAVLRSLAVDIRSAAADNLRDQRALVAEKELMERQKAFLQHGGMKLDAEMELAQRCLERLEALRARGEAATGKLARLRDEELAWITERSARLLEHSEENSLIAGAIRRFRAEGPNRERIERLPPGVPSADSIAVQESAAADSLQSWIRSYSVVAPDLLRRSHAVIWEPRALERPDSLITLAKDHLAWAKVVRRAVDSTLVVVSDPARLKPFEEKALASAQTLARLQKEQQSSRRSILTEAIARARAAHEREGEGIAFSLSIASHELAAAGARERARAEAEGQTAETDLPTGTDARKRLASFLEKYPDSRARAEIRYRLADLEIARAREDFATKIASFSGGQAPAANAPVSSLAPFVDYGPALELYQAILREDPGYEHRDAVLFHTGMILSDQGDPKSRAHLEELVSSYPSSPFCGRAALRMGDDDFEQHRLASAATQFESAAAKGDDEVRSIALYKLGWVHFNLDRFDSAAGSFFQLLDLYETKPDVLALTDLRNEAEESLIQSLARGGGAQSFSSTFGNDTQRSFDLRVLSGLAAHLRELSQYEAAADCDSLLLARHASAPEALDAAQHLVATLEEANRPDRALEARLLIAPRFSRDSDWARSIESDSLRAAGDEFARGSLEAAALERHRAARESKTPQAWEETLALHESLLAKWPGHEGSARTNFLAGEAALELGKHSSAIDHFKAAAQDSSTMGADASWQLVAVRDAWYENARKTDAPSDSLATSLLVEIDRFTTERPGDPRVAEALWRKADVAQRHSRFEDAAGAYEMFASQSPQDPRAQEAGRAAAHCRFKNAEAADADSSRALEAAKLFERVVEKSPSFEHGDAALYRAGLAYQRGGSTSDAIRTWSAMLERYPKSELSRDAHLQIASASKNSNDLDEAARAYERFSEAFPEDPEAAPALLEAADLLAKSSDDSASEAVRTRYLERFPGDTDAAFEIVGSRAEQELEGAKAGDDLAALPAVKRYRELAEQHPDLASPKILANISYLEGERARQAYESARLTQPLAPSLAAKKALLETVLQEYRQCAEAAVEPWSIAGAYRIGESLVTFGEALGQSERPADMSQEDLAAYEEVLENQKWEFFDRGEQAWTQLLKSANPTTEEGKKWMAQTREKLWPRIARRFLHRPELEYPLLGAEPPKKKATTETASEGNDHGSGS